MCLIEHLVAAGEDDLAKQQLQELEKHAPANFPVPDDEMELYYEELITGRVMTDVLSLKDKEIITSQGPWPLV